MHYKFKQGHFIDILRFTCKSNIFIECFCSKFYALIFITRIRFPRGRSDSDVIPESTVRRLLIRGGGGARVLIRHG